MICLATGLVILALSAPAYQQIAKTDTQPISPCPNVFEYEAPGSEQGRWYGVVNLSTDSTLHSLWLNIVLDGKADILGNWVGDVTTQDNIDFKVENTQMKINPGPAVAVRFFVQYNTLNRTPRLQAIRLNGREICNAKTPQPVPGVSRPVTSKPTRHETTTNHQTQTTRHQTQTQNPRPQPPDRNTYIRPEDSLQTQPIANRPTIEFVDRPSYTKPANSANPSSINGGDSSQLFEAGKGGDRRPSTGNRLTPAPPTRRPPTRHPDLTVDDQENSSKGDSEDVEYFVGGQPTFIIPSTTTVNNNSDQSQCGKVFLNKAVPLVVNGTPTLEGQWPWQVALYQTQTVDNKYICGGTLVSHRHFITAAHCVTRKNSKRVVNKDTLTVYLGKHNLRTSVNGVEIRFVSQITVHPQYNASTFSQDLSILELRDRVSYSNWIQPACLWPDSQTHLSYVIGKKGSVVGWGFDEKGIATEELSLVEMPVIDTETCIRSYSEFFVRFTSEYTYCAGYRDGTSVCNGDSGGGMVFRLGDSWYVRGLVSLSVARQNEFRCDPTHYVVFTDLAKFLPWIKDHVFDY